MNTGTVNAIRIRLWRITSDTLSSRLVLSCLVVHIIELDSEQTGPEHWVYTREPSAETGDIHSAPSRLVRPLAVPTTGAFE